MLEMERFFPAPRELGRSARREISTLFRRSGITMAAVRVDPGRHGFTPSADLNLVLDRLSVAAELVRELDCSLLLIDSGLLPPLPPERTIKPEISPGLAGALIIPEPEPRAEPPPFRPDPVLEGSVQTAMRELCALCDRWGVRAGLSTSLSPHAALEAVLRQVDCPMFGVDLDPVSVLRDDWDLDRVLSVHSKRLTHVTFRDATVGQDRRTRPAVPGRGDADLQALLAKLEAADYRGWVTLDVTELVDRASGVAAGAKLLERQP